MSQSKRFITLIAYLALLTSAMSWAGNAIAGRLGTDHVSPMLLTCMRWLLAIIVLSLIARPRIRNDIETILANWKQLALMGAIGFTAFNILLYMGLNHTTAINAAVVQSGIPMFILLVGFFILSSQINSLQWVGVALTIIGVCITASQGHPLQLFNQGLNIGDAMILAASFFYGTYALMLRFRPKLHWMSFIWALGISAFICAIPGALYEYASGTIIWPDMQGWLVILYAALIPSIVAQACFVVGTDIIGPGRAGLFINLVPIFSAILAPLILSETIEPYHILSLAIVMIGIFFSEKFATRTNA